MQIIQNIQNRIFEIRGERVMLDQDLAWLYDVETKVLNQSVKRNIKRNIKRFPEDFMFRLNSDEFDNVNFQFEAKNDQVPLRSQNVTSKGRGGRRYLPFAFTEQGVAMLSGVVHSEKAIQMNIEIMRAFVAIRKIVSGRDSLKIQLKEIRDRLGEHDVQLNMLYDALENLLDNNVSQRNWDNRERIGFT